MIWNIHDSLVSDAAHYSFQPEKIIHTVCNFGHYWNDIIIYYNYVHAECIVWNRHTRRGPILVHETKKPAMKKMVCSKEG